MMPFGGLELVVLLLGIGVFLWLKAREDKRAAKGETRLATWRLVVASVFGLIALFSGGCSLFFLPNVGNQYVDPAAILIVGGIPFAIAAFILWLSLRRGNG
jgi:hypothetical protein